PWFAGVPARGITSASAPPEAAVGLGWNISPAAEAMPIAASAEIVPRFILLSLRDNFIPGRHLLLIISLPQLLILYFEPQFNRALPPRPRGCGSSPRNSPRLCPALWEEFPARPSSGQAWVRCRAQVAERPLMWRCERSHCPRPFSASGECGR